PGAELRRGIEAEMIASPGGAETLDGLAQQRELGRSGTNGAPHWGADTVDELAAWEPGEVLQHRLEKPERLRSVPGLQPGGLRLNFDHVEQARVPLEQWLNRRRVSDADAQHWKRGARAATRGSVH